MKTKQLLLTLLTLLGSTTLRAYDAEVGGINYNFISANEAEVTGREEGQEPYSNSVVIPSSFIYDGNTYNVTRIGDATFIGCDNLTSVTIPNSVTSIGGDVIYGCPNLEFICVEQGNTYYDSRDNCNAIIETATNTLIYGCNNSVIPSSVTEIRYNAFLGSGLTSIVIPGNVTNIGFGAFAYCPNLTSVTISEGVTIIGNGAFLDCTSLVSITIPKSVTDISGELFGRRHSLASISVDPDNLFYDSRNDCNALIETETNTLISGCQNTIIPNDVTRIGGSAFFECLNLKSISIPESVTYIGSDAFYGCSSLTSITLPENEPYIEGPVFNGCGSLTSVTFPNSWTSIPNWIFSDCTGLTFITIPENVTSIGERAFSGCNGLRDIYCYAEEVPGTENEVFEGVNLRVAKLHVPAASVEAYSLTEPWSGFGSILVIGEEIYRHVEIDGIYYNLHASLSGNEAEVTFKEGFYDVAGIYRPINNDYSGNVVIPDFVTYMEKTYSVTSIGTEAFSGCDRLTSVTFGNNVTDVGDMAFWGCVRLTSMSFGDSVTKIGSNLFNGCSRLTSVTIPKSVTSISSRLFQDCDAMVSLNVEEGNPVYDSRDNCNAIIVTATNALMTGIKTTVIPNSVTEISGDAFYFCPGLTSITIPESVTEIGWGAFLCCYDLKDVYCYAGQVPYTPSTDVFYDTNIAEATLHVPVASVEAYSTTEPWSNFGSIVGVSEYVLSYMVDGEQYKSYSLYEGQSIVPEQEPTREGYTFSGWSETPVTMPAEDVVVTGTFSINSYTLSYMIDGEAYKTDTIVFGAAITPEDEPTREGCTFSGWSEIPETMPAHDVTVTGSFAVNPCTIIFDTDGGSPIAYISGEAGNKITPPDDPTREGYTFLGWEPAIPETMPEEGLIVVAQWQLNSYTLSYIIDGEVFKTDSIPYGTPLTLLEMPTKEGYTFSGWSDMPETMPAEDVIITGTFIVNQYLLTYMIDEEEYKSYEVDYNTAITPEPAPTKKGMTFSGWGEIPETMPAHDLTLSGTYNWSKETVDGIVYQVADTLSNYASVVGYDETREEVTLLSEVDIDGYTYMVNSLEEDVLPKTLTINTSIGKLLLWLWNNGYEDIKELESGRSLSAPEISLAASTASSLTLSYVNDYPEFSETVTVSDTPVEKGESGYTMKLTGLEPDNFYEGLATLTLTFEDVSYTKVCSFQTEPLTLTTLEPKVISEGNVIVAAESNLDDDETNVGFKWRRTAWEDDEDIFPSRSGLAYLYEGTMEGIIRNLNNNPWKVRPFYTSATGNTYYGKWRGIDPSDYSYFEPTVHTYAALAVTDSTAEVKGYAMQGTDDVESQGFMYWEDTPSASSRRKVNGIPADATIVEVPGYVMKTTLEGLDYDTEYRFVAFIKTKNGETFYGEQQSFRTTFDPDAIIEIKSEELRMKNEGVWYSLDGKKLAKPQKGINIIRYSDGTSKKVLVK